MGFFDSLFGRKEEYPPLDANSGTMELIKAMQAPLEKFCQETDDTLELIPTTETAYVFLGAPPKRFAIAWIDKDGTIHNFKTLAEQEGVSDMKLQRLIGKLGNAYRDSSKDDRFSTTLGGKELTVTQSDTLATNLKQVIEEATA